MLRKLSLIAACIAVLQFPVKATHLSGMDLTYKHISGNQYEITLKYYRDCIGIAAATSAEINFESSCGADFTFTLPKISVTEISVPCNNQATTCNGGAIPGYQLHLYRDTVTMPHQCANWILSYTECCRNCAITTTLGGCNDDLYIEARLDNTGNLNNNSPSFTNNPVAFMCLNQAFNYNHGVVDPDGDSLVFSLVNPLTSSGAVTFVAPYTAANFMSSSGGISFNSVTGDINLTPNMLQVAIAAIRVDEYRNGVLIGYVKRDLQFIVQSCTGNSLPTASGLNGTNVYTDNICAGDSVCYTINSNDADVLQNVTMTVNNPITGSTFTIVPGQHPTGTFCWKPSLADVSNLPYQFFVTVQDNACPTNGVQVYSYSIFVSAVTVSAVANGDDIDATVGSGTAPFDYLWSNGATTEDLSNVANGTYTITVTDDNGCTGTASATVFVNPCDVKVTMSKTHIKCWGDCTGTAKASPFDGTAPYSYLWSNGQTNQTATGLCKGLISVVVTDAAGCSVAGSIAVTQGKRIKNTMTVEVDCDDYCDSELTANPSGGKPPYTYLWSTGQTTQHIDKLCDGSTHTVTITDSKGCSRSFPKHIPSCPSPIYNNPGNVLKAQPSAIGTVLPNPSSDVFALTLHAESVNVKVMDLSGRILESYKNMASGAILIGKNLIPGIYLLNISNGTAAENIQLVKTE